MSERTQLEVLGEVREIARRNDIEYCSVDKTYSSSVTTNLDVEFRCYVGLPILESVYGKSWEDAIEKLKELVEG